MCTCQVMSLPPHPSPLFIHTPPVICRHANELCHCALSGDAGKARWSGQHKQMRGAGGEAPSSNIYPCTITHLSVLLQTGLMEAGSISFQMVTYNNHKLHPLAHSRSRQKLDLPSSHKLINSNVKGLQTEQKVPQRGGIQSKTEQSQQPSQLSKVCNAQVTRAKLQSHKLTGAIQA